MAEAVAALSLGRLASAQRCRRFLATLLDADTKPRPVAKGAFRLDSAVREAIRVAHEVADQRRGTVGDTLEEFPPPGLSAEERSRFRRAVQSYGEFVGDDPVSLHATAGEFLDRPSRTGRFRLTGRNDTTVVHRETNVVEIRRVHLGSRRAALLTLDTETIDEASTADPYDSPDAIDSDALLALLITKEAPTPTGTLPRVRHLWLGASTGETMRDVTGEAISAAARQLTELVERALLDPRETPGWWCDSCPAIRSCTAVSSMTDQDLATRLKPGGAALAVP